MRLQLLLAVQLAQTAGVLINTTCGPVVGTSVGAQQSFLSIPYAEPPVGDRRWQPPAACKPSSAPRDATKARAACLQKAHYSPKNGSAARFSEDCLTLHVWTRSDFGRPRPVVVWLHGGGLVEGSPLSIQSGFGAEANLSSSPDGVVVVGVQYRLGVAGFLALDELKARDLRGPAYAGNYGLLDVVAALRWVQSNIAAFGGDPAKVTVLGQSSGGSLILALLASPLTRSERLLSGAISMSGSPRLNATLDDATTFFHLEVLKRTRCANAAQGALRTACLLSLSATELVDAMPDDWHSAMFGIKSAFAPSFVYAPLLLIDGPGGVLPEDYRSAYRAHGAAAPLVIGVAAQESDFAPEADVRNLTSFAAFGAYVAATLHGDAYSDAFVADLLDVYGLTPRAAGATTAARAFAPQELFATIVTDATELCPSLLLASEALAPSESESTSEGGGSRVYAYVVTERMSAPSGFCPFAPFNAFGYCPRYSFHSVDEMLLFRPLWSPANGTPKYTYTEHDIAFSALEHSLLIAQFAANASVPPWDPVTRGAERGAERSSRGAAPVTPGGPDALPPQYSVVDLSLNGGNREGFKRRECDFWLRNGAFERWSWIN